MTPAEVERLARECIAEDWDKGGRYYRNMDLARFAALVQAAERERCALIVDANAALCVTKHGFVADIIASQAAAIRTS